MKFVPSLALLGLVLCTPYSLGQGLSASSESSATATLVEQWKTAVLAGDSAGLKKLYSMTPAAKVTAAGKESHADDDVDFWVALKARSIKSDIVQTSSPQTGIQVVVF